MSAVQMTAEPDDYGDNNAEAAPEQTSPAQQLVAIMQASNVAKHLADEKLTGIAAKVVDEYQIDRASRKDWEDRTAVAMDLAMLVAEEKSYPFPRAANVKFPLVTTAALQFNARAYPAIVSGERVAKAKVDGQDPDGQKAARAERISEHMSSQNLDADPNWEEDTDRLLVILPIVGCAFRKRYWDPSLLRQVSRLVTAKNLVVNYWARSLEDAPRVTEKLFLYPYEIEERIRDGRFVDFDYTAGSSAGDPEDDDPENDAGDDDDAPQLFLEQHRLLDLDDDDYPEPYIVTVHRASQKVCRIVANFTADTVHVDANQRITSIRKQQFYVKYLFLPSPDGGFYGMGLGTLLKDNNEAINGTLNMMLDAGHLSNIQGGFVAASLGIKEKSITLDPGKWKVLNTGAGKIGDSIYPFSYPGPSDVLFKLLGFLVDMGKDLASIKDVLTGDQRPNQTATATMALIEQGLKVFTAIFKRVHRSVKAELLIQANINRRYLSADAYNKFLGGGQQFDPKADYDMSDMAVVPVSDPSVSTQMQKLAKAAFLTETMKEFPAQMDPVETLKRVFNAGDIEDPDKLIMKPPQPTADQLAFDAMMKKLLLEKSEAEIMKALSIVLLNAATADAQVSAGELDKANLVLDALKTEVQAEAGQQQQQGQAPNDPTAGGQGIVPALAGAGGDPMGAAMPAGAGGAPGGGAGGIPAPVGGAQQPAGVAGPPA